VWLRRFRTTLLERAGVATSGADRLVAEHDGYRRLPGKPVHRRSWQMDSRGTCLTVQDQVLGSASQSVSLYWHFSEDCNVTCTPDGLIVSNGPIRLGMSLRKGRRERVARFGGAHGRMGVAGLRCDRAEHHGGVAG
jgi:hypothetical protein